jgi:hypothetical protein
VPGNLLRDGPTGRQACRHDRGSRDDLGRAEREVQVLRVLPGLAEDPLQDTAARDAVLSGPRVKQVKGVVVIEGSGPHVPTLEPYPPPIAISRRRAVGQP